MNVIPYNTLIILKIHYWQNFNVYCSGSYIPENRGSTFFGRVREPGFNYGLHHESPYLILVPAKLEFKQINSILPVT